MGREEKASKILETKNFVNFVILQKMGTLLNIFRENYLQVNISYKG